MTSFLGVMGSTRRMLPASLMALACLAAPSVSFAEPTEWTSYIPESTEARSVKVGPDGSVFVTGALRGALPGQANAGREDAFVAKYDSAGNPLWAQQLGTSGEDWGISVAVDASGNSYVAGSTRGGLDGNTSAGAYDLFLAKYDPSGNKQWTRQFGSATNDLARDIEVDSAGNIYVTGGLGRSYAQGNSSSYFGAFLAKFDTDGNEQWLRQDFNRQVGLAEALAIDPTGQVYITGDNYLARYDAAGNQTMTNNLFSLVGESVHAQGIGIDHAGNLILAGGVERSGQPDQVVVVKLDPDEGLRWETTLGPDTNRNQLDLVVDGEGDAYVTGRTTDVFGDNNTFNLGFDLFVAKTDSDGDKLWTTQIALGGHQFGWGIDVSADGSVYLAGETQVNLEEPEYGLSPQRPRGGFVALYVPEPTSGVVLGLLALPALMRRRR